MKKATAVSLLFALIAAPLLAGVGSHDAMYVGGTVTSIKAGTEGKVSTDDEKVYVFTYKDGKFSIPYDRVEALEYGQKAGRRVGLAIAISPWLLLSKKRKHFLTVSYKNENDQDQAVVFELGKDIVRVELASLGNL